MATLAEMKARLATLKGGGDSELAGMKAELALLKASPAGIYEQEREKALGKYKKYHSQEEVRKRYEARGGLAKARDYLLKIGQGATLNYSDELAAGAVATIKAATSDESWGDAYKRSHRDMGKERKAFETARPKTAFAAEFVGGMLTGGPVTKTVQKVTGKIPAKFGTKKVPEWGVEGAKKVAEWGVEGAVAGAGAAERGEILEGAGVGAATSVVLGSALKGAEKIVKGIGKMPGEPEKGTRVQRLNRIIADRARKIKNVPKVKKRLEKSIAARKDRQVRDVGLEADAKVRQTGVQEKAALKVTSARHETGMETAQKQADVNTQQTNQGFREHVALKATPEGVNALDKSMIAVLPVHKANKRLQKAWASDGPAFGMVKDRNFRFDQSAVSRALQEGVDEPGFDRYLPEIMSGLTKELNKVLKRDVEDIPQKGAAGVTSVFEAAYQKQLPTGDIPGKDLMELRNKWRRKIVGIEGSAEQRVHDQALNIASRKIDDVITEQLDDAGKIAFQKELDNYAGFVARMDATKRAVDDRGNFTPSHIVKATSTGPQGKPSLRGEAVLQQDAYKADDILNETKTGLDATMLKMGEANKQQTEAIKTAGADRKLDLKLTREEQINALKDDKARLNSAVERQMEIKTARLQAEKKDYENRLAAQPLVERLKADWKGYGRLAHPIASRVGSAIAREDTGGIRRWLGRGIEKAERGIRTPEAVGLTIDPALMGATLRRQISGEMGE